MAFETMTGMDEEGWGDADGKASPMQPDFMCVCSFDFEGNDERHLEQTASIPIKLTKTSSNLSSE